MCGLIGLQLGPYTIEAELGSGGMGTVYRATGPKGVVALKVVHPHLLATRGFFKRFLREAELGERVRHPNVVRTFDADALLHEGKNFHFMVMEYVEGKSLRELLIEMGRIPESLLREVALQTAAGLAAIHEAGIVHRDLKPENILITDDQDIRIMDLGVAKLQEATLGITSEGQFAGSLLYAAPEQFRGDVEVGPASDLYSLGVLLYELATGANPFRSDDVSAVIQSHLFERPPAAHERNESLSPFFSELVATLMAKQPSDRFESAAVLLTILEEAERSSWWFERALVRARPAARLPRIRVNRETRLHGRDHELQVLQDAWARARNGDGNTVFVEGEAGIGKTRLIDAFLRGLDEDPLHVLYGSYPPSGGMGGLSEAIIGKFGDARLTDALIPYLTVTPSLVPTFAALIKSASPPTGAAPLRGDALQAVMVHLMRALAEEKPTIWILDDLQFAPQDSLDFLLSMARAVEDHRVLLVVMARPGVAIEGLSRLGNFRRIALARLGAREVVELLEDAFRSEALAEKLGIRIAKKSDGVPFFVFEMIRGLREGHFIEQSPDGSYVQTQMIDEIEVPSAVKDLIEGRMRGLSREQRAILDAGAVQGMKFEPALIARVLDEKRVRVLQEIAEIERRFGLVRGEANTCSFDQNQIQEVLYQDLLPELRREYHTLLAEAHAERLAGDPTGADARFLASHHLRGVRPEEGLPHLIPALVHLEKSYRNDAAIALATRALEMPGLLKGRERAEVLLKKARRHELRGERELERAALDETLALTDSSEDTSLRATALVAMGWHLIHTSDDAAAQDYLERALALARKTGDKKTESTATGDLGVVSRNQGRYDEARARFERQLALAREIGDRTGETQSIGNLGLLSWSQGRYEEARAHHERWLALACSTGDRRGEAAATGNLGIVSWIQGDHEQARAHFEKHLALAREIGDRRGEANSTGNLGLVLLTQGRYEDSHANYEKCLRLARETGNRLAEAITTGNLGIVFLSLGCHDPARAHLGKWLALAREIGNRSQEGHALNYLASLADACGDPETALRLGQEALAIGRELGEQGTLARTLVALAGIESRQGDPQNALARLEEALDLAREMKEPGPLLLATVHRAQLLGGETDAALAALEEHEGHVEHDTRMEARFRMWELTSDKTHLTEAKRLLDFAVEHSPAKYRTSMLENVPLHRDITKAWEEHGKA